MNPLNNKAGETNVEPRYRVMLMLWFPILISMVLFLMLTIFVAGPRVDGGPADADGTNKIVMLVCGAAGGFTFLMSFILKRKYYSQAVEQRNPALMQTGFVLALALCEATSLFGLLIYFVTRDPSAYLLFALAALGMLLHFPRKSQLLAASGERPKFGM